MGAAKMMTHKNCYRKLLRQIYACDTVAFCAGGAATRTMAAKIAT